MAGAEAVLLVLGIETSTSHGSVALSVDGTALVSAELGKERHHAEFVAPAIEFLFSRTNTTPADLDAIAVGIGPGLFTGLRVGIATAQLMADVLEIPVTGCASVDLLAHQAGAEAMPIVSAVDARRGEVFWAEYRNVDGAIERVGEINLSTPEDCALSVDREALPLLVGDGAVAFRDEFESFGLTRFGPLAAAHPSATALNEMATNLLASGGGSDPGEVLPIYMRHSDAKINWDASRREALLLAAGPS